MTEIRRALMFSTLALATATCTITMVACGPAPKAPLIVESNPQPTMKPDSVSTTQVALTTMTEVSHLERALKPFIGSITAPISEPPQALAGLDVSKCRVTASTDKTMWETRWRCGLDATESGKKEIEGVERVNYETSSRTLTYNAQFETRNFDDREARSNAHTLQTSRRITVVFTGPATSTTSNANVKMVSSSSLKRSDISRKGSNWTSTLTGKISRAGATWALDRGTILRFRGALFGLDEYRYTNWASGDFDFVSETIVTLAGLGDGLGTCTKPVGVWKIDASGGGQNFDTKLETSISGGQTQSGGSFSWPVNLCDQP